MMLRCWLLLLLIPCFTKAQLTFNAAVDLGNIAEAYEIKGDLVLKNESAKKIYLMRADADAGVKVYASRKTLQPGDTSLLVISFVPDGNGRFRKKINLVSSDKATPYEIDVTGNLAHLKSDDKTACYYFGSRRNATTTIKEGQIVVTQPTEKRDNSNRMPDNSSEPPPAPAAPATAPPVVSQPATPPPVKETPVKEEPAKTEPSSELSIDEYKPNNILFLVDVSGSMKDSLKLPLMKSALHTLIDAVRDVDQITFVTYADSVKIISEAVKGSDKRSLHNTVDGLKAKGLTKGNKAILFSQQLAQKHFIAGGNNQVILATDGKFRFYPDDVKTWTQRQGDKKIIMSTVAFGNDHDAMQTLKEIADKGNGSFIHIRKRNGSQHKLLDEIKERSRR